MSLIPVRFAAVGLMSALSLVIAACGADTPDPTPTPSPPAQQAPEGHDSVMQSFTLQDITVPVGTAITWTNLDSPNHTVTAGASGEQTGEFNSGRIGKSSTYTHTFDQAGTFAYFCTVHPSMLGTVTVLNADAAGAGAEPASGTVDFGDGY